MLEIGWPPKSQICRITIELLRHHDGTKFEKTLNSKISKFFRISDA